MRWLNTPFSWRAPYIDETPRTSESPDELVRRLSIAKARAIAPAFNRHYIIGSDQIALHGMEVLGKPNSRERAAEQLAAASGCVVRFLTGLCVLESSTDTCQVEVVPCDVHFRNLTRTQIEAYLDAEAPYDCAGSFKAEGLGIALFDKIVCDDPTALTGLPLIELVAMLRNLGLDVLGKRGAAFPPAEFQHGQSGGAT